MRSKLSLAAFFLGMIVTADMAFAAGRGGFRDGGGLPQNSPPTGSGGFRSFAPPPAPSNFSRPSNPVVERVPRAVNAEERREPAASGNSAALPSMNVPFHQAQANQFRQIPPQQSIPSQPSRRAADREDFLGMPDERSARGPTAVPNRFLPQAPSSSMDRNAVVAPGKSIWQAPRLPTLPNPPGRPGRPAPAPLPERWRTANEHFTNQLNQWTRANAANLATFEASRSARWNQVQRGQSGATWRGQYRTAQYQQWRHGVWDYRKSRAEEIWDRTQFLHDNLFDNHWWATCWWRRHPWVIIANEPPWWWWNPASWADESAFFGSDLGAAPIPYDPGTNVFYDGDAYDVDGQDAGSAMAARDQADALANPQVDEIPVPAPEPDGQPQQWLPLGAWALTQQEQGDAVLFFQLSVNRSGIVAGGYKNALTGDEQPIIGQLDKGRQRMAWHVANAPQTVFETGLSSLDYDVASVFVHFSGAQTQTWLLVRLPSPEMPPGPVRIPGDAN